MNFANLKKVLILSSALLAFGNVSNAASNHGIKQTIYNINNVTSSVNSAAMLNNIIEGISDTIEKSNNKDEILQSICANSTGLEILKDNRPNEIVSYIINETLNNDEGIESDEELQDVKDSYKLVNCLKLIKRIEAIKSKQDNPVEVPSDGNNAPYDLFKQIALGIDDTGIEELKSSIAKKANNYDESNDNNSFFIEILEEISNVSTYTAKQDNLNLLNATRRKLDGEFLISPNHKFYYSSHAKNVVSEKIKRTSARLEKLMEVVNTKFTMTNSDYNTLSNMVDLVNVNNMNKFINSPTTNFVTSLSDFSSLLREISSGTVFDNHKPEQNLSDNEIKNLEEKMNNITLDDIMILYRKELVNNLTEEEKQEFDYYKDTYLVELRNREKTENLSEREKAILDYEKAKQNINNDENKKPINDNINKYNIPGITDKLKEKNLYIADITATPNAPANAKKVILLNDINGLLNSGAGTVVIDGHINSVKGLVEPQDRILRTAIGQIIKRNRKLNENNESIIQEFVKPANIYLMITIKELQQ